MHTLRTKFKIKSAGKEKLHDVSCEQPRGEGGGYISCTHPSSNCNSTRGSGFKQPKPRSRKQDRICEKRMNWLKMNENFAAKQEKVTKGKAKSYFHQ